LSFSPNRQLDFLADFLFQNLVLKLRIRADKVGIDLSDYFERPQIALVGGSVGFDRSDYDAFLNPFEQLADGRIVAERFDSDPEPRARDLVSRDQFLRDFFGHVTRHSEAQAAVDSVNQRVHTDHFSIDIAERTAAVAGIDRGISL